MKTDQPLIKTFDEYQQASDKHDQWLDAYRVEIKANGTQSKQAISLEKKMIEIEELMRKSSRNLKMSRLGIRMINDRAAFKIQ
jgi:hypothetical protein